MSEGSGEAAYIVMFLLPLLYLFTNTIPINLRSRNIFFSKWTKYLEVTNIFSLKTMKVFVYSYKETQWLKYSLAMAVKTYVTKAEVQLFLNLYSFYFYAARNTKNLM